MFWGWALSFEPRMRSWAPEADGDAVNTLVFRDGSVLGSNTDREILRGIEATRACLICSRLTATWTLT